MKIQLQETVDRIYTTPEYRDNVYTKFEHDGTFMSPEVMFSPDRALDQLDNQEVASAVMDVYIARSSATAIKYLLEESSENENRHLDLVPRDFKYNQPDIYAKLLSTQNDYLEQHRNIGLVTITTDAMHHQKVKDVEGKEWKSMYDALSTGPDIAQINASKRTYGLGKCNVSTTHDTWESAKAWLDRHLLPLYHSIPTDVRNNYCSFGDFTEPQRLQFRPPQSTRSTSDTTSTYAQRIQTQLLGTATVPVTTTQRPPAWKAKRPKLVWTFNQEDFPPMYAQTPKQTTCDELSTGSQPSTATTNSMTTTASSDSLKKLQEQWKQQKAALETDFNTQLSTMDDTVKKVLNRMDDIDKRIDTKMTSMQHSLQTMIDAKLDVPSLVMQVAAAIGGEASPFVAVASLKLTMKGFIEQINARIDNLAPVPTGNPSKCKKALQDKSDSEYDDNMDEDENNTIAAATKKAAGHK
jgi:hypothetical protein